MTPPTDKDLDELEARARDLDANFKMAVLSELAAAITALREEKARLEGALTEIALGDGHYGQQAGEYKKIARQALKEPTQ